MQEISVLVGGLSTQRARPTPVAMTAEPRDPPAEVSSRTRRDAFSKSMPVLRTRAASIVPAESITTALVNEEPMSTPVKHLGPISSASRQPGRKLLGQRLDRGLGLVLGKTTQIAKDAGKRRRPDRSEERRVGRER